MSDQVVETAGLGLGVAAAIFYPILFAATLLQMSLTFYNTWMYWLVVILMSVCGTIATDGLHDDLGLALWIEVLIYGSLAAANFALWFWVEGTLAIHSVFTIRREGFYWCVCALMGLRCRWHCPVDVCEYIYYIYIYIYTTYGAQMSQSESWVAPYNRDIHSCTG